MKIYSQIAKVSDYLPYKFEKIGLSILQGFMRYFITLTLFIVLQFDFNNTAKYDCFDVYFVCTLTEKS